MRYLHSAAALLLSSFATALVIPTDPLPSASRADSPERLLGRDRATVFQYDELHGSVLRFTLPCEGCEEEDKAVIENEEFVVTVPSIDDPNCSRELDTGITVNGSPLITETFDGSVRLAHPNDLYFNNNTQITFNADWELTCGCMFRLDAAPHDSTDCAELGYALTFQLKSRSSDKIETGFTLTYDQHGGLVDMRFSPFVVDYRTGFDTVDFSNFQNTPHWDSPRLVPQPSSGVDAHASSSLGSLYVPTFSTSSLLAKVTGSSQFETTSTLEDGPSTTAPAPVVNTDALHPGYQPTAAPSSRLRTQSHHFLGDVKHRIENFEQHALHAAQVVLHELDQHLPHCKHDEQYMQAPLTPWRPTRLSKSPAATPSTKPKPFNLSSDSHFVSATSNWSSTDHESTIKAVKISSIVVLIVSAGGLVFAYIRRDPRRRADFAARCEERRNQRLYRRAARRQKFQNFFNRLRGVKTESRTYMMPHSPTQATWAQNEKSFASDPNGLRAYAYPKSHVTEELSGIRKAHRFVEGILKTGVRSSSKGGSRARRNARSYSWAESEKSTPPPYEESSEDTIVTVDGLTFISSTLHDESPDSSVIDTSSRNSCCDTSDDEKI